MKIRFLGTSHGVPMPGRHCQCILIEAGDSSYLIDAGAPVMDILINDGYDLNRIKAVFVTHMHDDHTNGITNMVCLASWKYTDMRFKVFLPEQRSIDSFKNFCSSMLSAESQSLAVGRIEYALFGAGCVYDDGNIKISAFHTDHMCLTSGIAYGFLVEAEGKRVYVTGDMHASLKDFNTLLYGEHTDLIISECAHFEPARLCEKLKCCRTDAVAVIHVSPVRKYDEFKKLEKELDCRVIYPNDGDALEI